MNIPVPELENFLNLEEMTRISTAPGGVELNEKISETKQLIKLLDNAGKRLEVARVHAMELEELSLEHLRRLRTEAGL